MAREVVSVRVSPTGIAKVDELAVRAGCSRSEALRVLLGVAVRNKDVLDGALAILKREEGF